MRIAIIGAGFAGLAASWFLLKKNPNLEIDLFDPYLPGEGAASSISAGICHKYGGLHCKLNRFGVEGISKTAELLKALNDPSMIISRKILRLAFTQTQIEDYRRTAQSHEDVEWLEPHECREIYPHLPPVPGILIHSGFTINVSAYTKKLFDNLQIHKNLRFIKQAVTKISDLQEYDVVIGAAGAATAKFPEFSALGLHVNKGQLLEIKWPPSLPPLPCSVVSQHYLSMTSGNESAILGSTYERSYQNGEPDIRTAEQELLPKLTQLCPVLKEAKITAVKAAFRLSTPTHLPYAEKVKDRLWCLAGFGSRGLLYHALYAEKLAASLFDEKGMAFGSKIEEKDRSGS